jgi:hypothetical protein
MCGGWPLHGSLGASEELGCALEVLVAVGHIVAELPNAVRNLIDLTAQPLPKSRPTLSPRCHNPAATRRHPVTCPETTRAGQKTSSHLSKFRERPSCGL